MVAASVVVALIVSSEGGSKPVASSTTSVTPPRAGTTSRPTTTTPSGRVVGQINLVSPDGDSEPVGIADIVKQAADTSVVIVASGVTPNTKHNACAVWLLTPPATAKLLGFVNPRVGANGKLQGSRCPADERVAQGVARHA